MKHKMTCCKTINYPQQIDYSIPNQKRFIYETEDGDIELILYIYAHQLFFLVINASSNFLTYEPTRFQIYNKVENVFEMPIGDGFLLFKEWSYDIYDRNNLICSMDSVSELLFH